MKIIRYAAAAALTLTGLFTAAACSPGAGEGSQADEGVNTTKAAEECGLLADLMTGDTAMTAAEAAETVDVLKGLSHDGYPENAKLAGIIVATSLDEDAVTQDEANAAVEDWGDFCTRNTAA